MCRVPPPSWPSCTTHLRCVSNTLVSCCATLTGMATRSQRAAQETEAARQPEGRLVGQGLPGTEELGRLARLTRTELGHRVAEVADRIGVTDSYVRAVERGDRAPSPKVTADLFKSLGFTVFVEIDSAGHERADLVLEREGRRWFV